MAGGSGSARAVPIGLLLVTFIAIGFGVIAAVLANPSHAVTPSVAPSYAGSGLLELTVGGYLALALVLGVLGYWAFQRIRGRSIGLPLRFVLIVVVLLVLATAAVEIFHAIGAPGAPAARSVPSNSTLNTSAPGSSANHSLGNVSTRPGAPGPLPSLPSFSWLDLGIVLLAIVVGVGLYAAWPRRSEGPEPSTEELRRHAEKLRSELMDSLRRLEADPEADPRELIRSLYQRLLLALEPRLRRIDPYTPREIEAVIVSAYGVRASNAEELTRLFEEARYSSHPMGREAATRARRALTSVLTDLDAEAQSRAVDALARGPSAGGGGG